MGSAGIRQERIEQRAIIPSGWFHHIGGVHQRGYEKSRLARTQNSDPSLAAPVVKPSSPISGALLPRQRATGEAANDPKRHFGTANCRIAKSLATRRTLPSLAVREPARRNTAQLWLIFAQYLNTDASRS